MADPVWIFFYLFLLSFPHFLFFSPTIPGFPPS